MATVLLLLLLAHLQPGDLKDEAIFRLNCPQAPCWRYWNGNCYCIEANRKGTWNEALKFCKRYSHTELVAFASFVEKYWIMGLPLDNFWTGLNNLDGMTTFSWSEGTPANMRLSWLQLSHPVQPNTTYCVKVSKHSLVALQCSTKAHWICKRSACELQLKEGTVGRCVGLDLANQTALILNCSEKYKWICKRKEMVDIFDVFVDRFISGPLEPEYYISFSAAVVDCLSDFNCTGIVQDYQYFRRTRGIDEIDTYEEAATAYIKRVYSNVGVFVILYTECSFGYYGENCASVCDQCYGGLRCNSVTGKCPEKMQCIGAFKGEMCELGIKHPKCPPSGPWWFFDGRCYYFEIGLKVYHPWASERCSYFKDGHLIKIKNEKEKVF
ncbi:hypothetical protein lerEdw1_016308 [Lerista edwardsae]|nr:hypothetical protein lerEdw1_016308 [Lerista edwardsae]